MSTLNRRMKIGRYKFTKTGEGQYAEVSLTHTDLGLPEPFVQIIEPIVLTPAPEVEPEPETFAPTPLGPIELKDEEDQRFAEAYRAGEATDSAGNRIDGTNKLWPNKGVQSLVGVREDYDANDLGFRNVNEQSHMDQRLLGTNDRAGNPIVDDGWKMGEPEPVKTIQGFTRSGEPLAAGLSQETYNRMMKDWRRSVREPSMSEQREAVERSKAVIREAFSFARRQR